MRNRIRTNGVLYEAVNTHPHTRTLRESYGKKVSTRDLYYDYDLSMKRTFGPNLAWDKNDGLSIILGGDDDGSPILVIQDNPNGDTNDWSNGTHYYQKEYENSKEGYEDAVDDFQSVCKSIDSGTPAKRVAKRVGFEDFGVM